MKKILILVLISVLMVGCSSGESTPEATKTPEKQVANVEADLVDESHESQEYVFETKGVTIAVNAQVAPILDDLHL